MSLIEFFNDPKSAVIFYAGIGISILFLIAITKLIYGPKGLPKKKDRITDTILKLVSLEHQSDNYSRGLSGGMKRRLMIAKALVHQPPIIFLEEPTAGVDVE